MIDDPIIAEIRAFREEYARRFNYDLRAMIEDIQRRQRESGRKVVSFARRRPENAESEAK